MPVVEIEGKGKREVDAGTRLVLAIEEAGMDIGHRCGGFARCTTCRVQFIEGEPATMTKPEYEKLKERELLGEARLSCQITVEHDMKVRVLMRVSENGWADPGKTPEKTVTPEAVWYPLERLKNQQHS